MNEPIYPAKKPNGCWKLFGWLLTIVSALFIAFFISMIFYLDEELDKKRAEYSASTAEYEEAMKAYEADSAHLHAEYQRILSEIELAEEHHDSAQVSLLQGSLVYYGEPEWHPRGVIGDNIGGAFFLFLAILMLVPFGIGLLMLIYYGYKKRKWRSHIVTDTLTRKII